MKSLFAVLLAAVMVFSFAACSSDKDDTNTTTSTSTSTESESTEEEPVEEVASDENTETESTDETTTGEASSDEETSSEEAEGDTTDDTSTAEEQVITGTITESAEGTVTIETEDGTALTFSIPDDADQTEVNGMTVGDTLEITYTGSIEGEDTWYRPLQKPLTQSNSQYRFHILSISLCRQRGTVLQCLFVCIKSS